ncbi:MAG: HEAT repeat domain-containing protein [Chloroflexota bacterium]|nr:HEAT repeat domain-containing protein [Chloroflexota bacterium]
MGVFKQRIDESDIESMEAKGDLQGLTRAIRNEGSVAIREAASGAVMRIGDAAQVPVLIQALTDESNVVRSNAVQALGRIGDTRAVAPLTKALKDKVWLIRRDAAQALGKFGKAASESLVEALKDEDACVREQAADALRKSGDTTVVLALTQALKEESHGIHYDALEAIVKLGYPRTVELLVRNLTDQETDVCHRAAEALDQLAWIPSSESERIHYFIAKGQWEELAKMGDEGVHHLVESLKHEDGAIPWGPIWALQRTGDGRVTDVLIAALQDKDAWIRRDAAQALGELRDARAVEPLVTAMRDDNAWVRRDAAEALGRIGETAVSDLLRSYEEQKHEVNWDELESHRKNSQAKTLELLSEALKDVSSDVRQKAADSLEKLGWQPQDETNSAYYLMARGQWDELIMYGELGLTLLIRAAVDPNEPGRWGAAAALGKTRDIKAVQPLVHALHDPDRWVRRHAVQAIGKVGDPGAIPYIIEMLKDADPMVRRNAIVALGESGDTAIEPLLEILNNQELSVRWDAIEALRKLDHPRTIVLLNEALKNPDMEIREKAAEALDYLGWEPADGSELAYYLMVRGQWDEIVAVGTVAIDPLIETLLSDHPLRWGAAWALGKIGESRAVPALIQALADRNARVRRNTAKALGSIGDDAAVEPLVKSLGDEDSRVRKDAADALGEIGQSAVQPLVHTLNTASDQKVRWHALEALRNISDVGVIDVLIQALRDENLVARERAAEALERLGWEPIEQADKAPFLIVRGQWEDLANMGEEALDPTIQSLADRDPSIRWGAAWTLGEIGDSRAIPFLIAALDNKDNYVRRHVIESLGRIGGAEAAPPLINALEDDDVWVRRDAVNALANVGRPAVEPLIENLMKAEHGVRWYELEAIRKLQDRGAVDCLCTVLNGQNKEAQNKAAQILDLLGWEPSSDTEKALYLIVKRQWESMLSLGKSSVQPLIAAMKDESWLVRSGAAWTLGRLGDVEAIQALAEATEDQDNWVRRNAVIALGDIGAARVAEPLVKSLKDEDNWVQRYSVESLAKVGQPAVEPLVNMLKSEDRDIRWNVIDALSRIKDPSVVELLTLSLRDGNSDIRERAVEALDKLGWKPEDDMAQARYFIVKKQWKKLAKLGNKAVAPLIDALRDKSQPVRWGAAWALGEIKDVRAVEPLVESLKDEDSWVQMDAVQALAKIGKPAVDLLVIALQDESWVARSKAAEALGKIGDKRAVEPLIEALRDEYGDVREKAAEALEKTGRGKAD